MIKRGPGMRRQLWQILDCNPDSLLVKHPQLISETVPLFGIEIEVENYSNWLLSPESIMEEYCKFESVVDNSLRNSGIEFRSKLPMDFSTSSHCVTKLLEWLSKNRCEFSHRTSIHVHNNMWFKDLQEISLYIQWYFMAENALYRFAGRNRNYNNFCVPLHAMGWLKAKLDNPQTFPKYSGLGGCRFKDLGTLEWRQMPGTEDAAKVVTWLKMIHDLDMYTSDPSCVSPMTLAPHVILTRLCELFPACDFSLDEVVCDYFHLKGFM